MIRFDLITAPTGLPVELSEAKSHARILQQVEDPMMTRWLNSLTQRVQDRTDRQCLTATFELVMDCFEDERRVRPSWGRIELRPAPLVDVISVKYLDQAGVEQTMPTDQYFVSSPTGPSCEAGAVILGPGLSWPATQDDRPEAVRIRFTAGYGPAAAVPQQLKDAICAGLEAMDANRGDAAIDEALYPHIKDMVLWR